MKHITVTVITIDGEKHKYENRPQEHYNAGCLFLTWVTDKGIEQSDAFPLTSIRKIERR